MNKKLLLINGYNSTLKIESNRKQFYKDFQKIYHELLNFDIFERFFNRIDFKYIDDCWNWLGPQQPIKNGNYGRISINYEEYKTHRLMYYLIYDSFDPEMWILHSCDNPPCCNPNHLRIGTPADNSKDMVLKNRQAQGSKIPQSKLNENIICNILDDVLIGNLTSIKQIMKKYNISQSAAYHIFDGIHWKNIINEYCLNKNIQFKSIRNKIVNGTNSYFTNI
jgi:hypothetical protein